MFNNNSEVFHVNSTSLDTERLGRYPFTRQGLYQVVLFGVEMTIVSWGTLVPVWEMAVSLRCCWEFGIPLLPEPGSKYLPHTPGLWQPRASLCLGPWTSSFLGEEIFAGAGFQLRGATTEPCACLHFVEKKNFINCSSPRLSWWSRWRGFHVFRYPPS